MKRNKHLKLTISIIIMAVAIAIFIILIRVFMIDIFHLSEVEATTAMTIGQVVAGAAGAIMIIIQLDRERRVESEQTKIQEAQFILQYNQAFIQDENMTYVEHALENAMIDNKNGDASRKEILNEDNQQLFINYLVYLEGLAPLILNNVIQLDHIDDLMAYRFFLIVNNKEMQQKELMKFPDYYKGCFKLYDIWKRYRKECHYPILQGEQQLDKWLDYENYIDSGYGIRNAEIGDLAIVAEILYDTDPYIYPTAFKDKRMARRRFPLIMKDEGSAYYYKNIRVAVDKKNKVVGAICFYNNQSISNSYDYYKALGLKDDKASHVCMNYFNHLHQYTESNDIYYIVALCVAEEYRNSHIGRMLLKSVLIDHHDKTVSLDVLDSNEYAIKMYEYCGFAKVGEKNEGYAYPPAERPFCFRMVRKPSDEWIIKKYE